MIQENLAFITSPLQLMNLREFCESKSINKETFQIVLKYSKNPISAQSLEREIARDKENWGAIFTIPNTKKFLHSRAITRKLQSRAWLLLVSGEINSWWQNVIAANISYKKRVIIDDGTMTVFDYHTRLTDGFTFNKSKVVKNLALKAMGLTPPSFHQERVTLFTIFPLPPTEHVKIEKNELTFFKTTLHSSDYKKTKKPSLCTAFIGQPLTMEGLISEQEYIDVISDFAKKFVEKCIYFPHRSEHPGTLSKINDIDGIEVAEHGAPIEKVIGSNDSMYQAIGGIYSTALFTLHILCPKTPIYFYPISQLKTASEKLVERVTVIETYLLQQDNTIACSWKS